MAIVELHPVPKTIITETTAAWTLATEYVYAKTNLLMGFCD